MHASKVFQRALGGNVERNLYLVVACAVLPALALLLWVGIAERQEELEKNDVSLMQLAKSIATIQAERTGRSRLLLQTLAALPDVVNGDQARCTAIFAQILQREEGLMNVVLTDLVGDVISSGLPMNKKTSVADRFAFQEAMRNHDFNAGEFIISKFVNIPVLQFSYPVTNEFGVVTGILFVSENLGRYGRYFSETPLPPTSRLVLADRNGIRIVSLARDTENRPIGEPVLDRLWLAIMGSTQDWGLFDSHRREGTPSRYAFIKLRLRPEDAPYMVVLANTPPSAALARANQTLFTSVLLLLSAAALALIIARLLGRAIVGRQVESLRQSEDRYRSLVEEQSELVCRVTSQEVYAFVNEAYCRFFGKTREALVGSSWLSEAWEEDVPLIRREMARLTPDNPVVTVENRVRLPSGDSRWVQFSHRALFGPEKTITEVQSVGRDVTDRKRAEEALREREEQLSALLDALPDAVSFKDGQGRWITANAVNLALFGLDGADWAGKTDLELADRVPACAAALAACAASDEAAWASGGLCRCEECVPGPNATQRVFDVIKVPVFHPDGSRKGLVIVGRDITERKRIETELIAARGKAEMANTAKSVFLANMSHEVRTPLNGILGILQLLETEELSRDQRESVVMAREAANRLNRLLGDILDISRIDAGKLELREGRFRPSGLLAETLALLATAARDKGIGLDGSVAWGMPPVLVGDEARIMQILFNLVGNAVKFTARGGVGVLLSAARLPARPGRAALHIAVEDSGPGIADHVLPRLFHPFSQADSTFTRKYQGAGLGLSIVRRLARLMDGCVCVDSEEGRGTTVHVTVQVGLPAGESPDPDAPDAGQGKPGRPLRVLLAEDDEISRLTASRMLERFGHDVQRVQNGREAISLLGRERFDLAILDIQMPEANGMDVTRALRDLPDERRDTPVIAMTGYAMAGDRETFLAAGFNGYIAKPVDMDTLAREIAAVTGRPDPGGNRAS